MKEKRIKTWKWLRADGRGTHGDMAYEAGYIYTTDEPRIVPCASGIHGSVHPMDALQYAPGPVLARCVQWGEVAEHGHPPDKVASRHCEVLWTYDASRELRLFACWCVRQVWHMLKDERSRTAVKMAERYARGEATAKELAAARDAASAAARAAARAAAWDAASAAARDAAREAAWAAARDAAWDAQRAELLRVCKEIEQREEGKP